MKNTFFFAALFGIFSCDSGVEIERSAPEKLVAVSSFISPQDSLVKVYVYQAKALGDVADVAKARIKNAEVTITDGSIVRILVFNEQAECYVISNKIMKISASKTYTLTVKTNEAIVEATCQVPPDFLPPNISGIQNGNNYDYSFYWANVSQQPLFLTYDTQLKEVDFKPKLGQSTGPYTSILVTSYALIDNKETVKKDISQTIFNAFLADKISINLKIWSLDSNTYHYLKTKTDASTWANNTDSFFPNLQEPQPVYSNIKGGVGVFGAFNLAEQIIKIK